MRLKMYTNANAVYVGKLIQPNKPVDDSSLDDAHLNPDADHVVKFLYANDEHKFLIDKTLRADQGLTFDVFKDLEEVKNDEPPAEEEQEDGHEVKPAVQEEKEKLPRFLLVPEVVREPRMFFYRVPRLGSYMAIRLEFQSCMFEEAFDAGLADYLNMQEREKER